ncbi:MAG: hypothetical protein IPM17_09915 [Verrucomicrobia bacterium]|nr:hypothetical protein [Verrucomicrobiota bacterium]
MRILGLFGRASLGLAAAVCFTPLTWAFPVITDVVETGGDDEPTDTIVAKWTGVTFEATVAGEPIPGIAVGTPFTVPFFGEEVPAYVDRNHQWTGATPTLLIPQYLLGGEYIMSGNDNRDNPSYTLDVTISKKSFVYLLIDDRLGDGSNANPPNYPDWSLTRTGAAEPDMRWVVDEGWQPVKTGHNRHGNPDWPDHIGVDEGADGAGPGQGVNQWSSIYMKVFEAGTFQIKQPDNNGQNMYGVVVVPYPEKPILTASRGDLFGVTFTILDGSVTRVKADSVSLTFDGAPVTPTVSKTGDTTTIQYRALPFLPSGSAHTAVLSFTDDGTPATPTTSTLNFTVEVFANLTAADAVPADQVDTTTSGFLARVVQARDTASWPTLDLPNNTQRAEDQLAGRLVDPISGNALANYAVAGSGPRGLHPVTVVNWNQEARPVTGTQAQAGNFTAASNPPFPDEPIPGIPGTDPDSPDNTDNIAAEIVGYLELKAGLHRLGVNSDDGFRLTAGHGTSAKQLGVFSGGRGSADSLFYVSVEQDGIYPVRLIWYEGGGGANVEFFSEDFASTPPVKILVNDRANAKAIRAYSRLRSTPPSVSVSPLPGAVNVWPGLAIQAQITDQDTAVAAGSVKLLVNGEEVTAAVSKSGGVTTVKYQPAGLLPSGQTVQAEVRFSDTASPANQIAHPWQFTVREYSALPVLQAGHAVPANLINRSTSGFAVDIYQMIDSQTSAPAPRPGNANTIATAEMQMARAYIDPFTQAPYENGAFPGSLPGGLHEVEVINWNQTAPANAGAFTAGNDPAVINPNFTDAEIPGIFAGDTAAQNWIAGTAVGYVELKAGIYRFGVNSDDGFKLLAGTDPADLAAPVLGQFDGGRGTTADLPQSACDFVVAQDGIYPIRLLWFEGEGGASCELHNVEMQGNSSTLLNDRNRALHLKVYRQYTGSALPILRSVTPVRGAGGVARDAGIEAVIGNYSGAVTLRVNGVDVTPQTSVAGGATTVRYTPPAPYPANSTVSVVLGYNNGLEYAWSYTVGTGFLNGPKIAWVSFHPGDTQPSSDAAAAGFTEAPDAAYTRLLAQNGYVVTRIVTSGSPNTALLNTFDLVIISRSVPSGDYQNAPSTAAWNGITKPMMILGGYVLRNSRLGFTTGGTIPDTAGTISLTVTDPSHPVFEGIALGAGNTMVNAYANIVSFNGVVQRGISVNTDPVAGNGKVLATVATPTDPAFNGMIIGEWNAGATMGNGSADVLGGRRLVFLTGSREQGFTAHGAGIYDLTADGEKMFMNAVRYMSETAPPPVPPTLTIQRSGGSVVVTWNPAGGVLESSTNLTTWTPVTGASSPATLPIGAGNVFYRVRK